jgi:hypothetical protein
VTYTEVTAIAASGSFFASLPSSAHANVTSLQRRNLTSHEFWRRGYAYFIYIEVMFAREDFYQLKGDKNNEKKIIFH